MPMFLKVILLLINLFITIYLFLIQSFSLAVLSSLICCYQIYIYICLKEFENYNCFNKRSKVLSMICNLIILLIIARFIDVQMIKSSSYKKEINRQINGVIKKQGKRGNILDVEGKQLAYNKNTYNIIVDPTRIFNTENGELFLEEMKKQRFLNGDIKKIKKSIKYYKDKGSKYRVIEKKISETNKIAVEDLLKKYKLRKNEVFFETINEREYYRRSIYQYIVGNIGYPPNTKGTTKVGVFGIEKEYEKYLKGKRIEFHDTFTKKRDIKLPTSKDKILKELNGKDVYLTINDEINYILDDEMEKAFKKTRAEEAYAIIMNPKNGKILGSSYFSKNKKILRNPLFQDQFELGSIVKPIIVAAGLEERVITENSKFDVGDGRIVKYRHTIKEASRSVRGILTVSDILKRSSNVGMVLIGDLFTNEKFEYYLRRFGLLDKTKIDFPNELKPYSIPYKKWDGLKRSTMSFGQGIANTPIQFMAAFSSIINGGILYKPYLVEKIVDKNGVIIRRNLPLEVRRTVSTEVSEKIKKILENTVNEGTGKRAILNGYRIGGKTGTGQLPSPSGGYYKNEYLSTFAGFFPVQDPEYAILVMFLKAEGANINYKYGGSIAAPVFGEVVSRITQNKKMLPNEVKKFQNKRSNKKEALEEDTEVILKVNPNENQFEIMPNLTGKNTKEVFNVFKNSKYKIEIEGRGVVKEHFPKAGSNLKYLETIKIILEEDR